MLSFYEDKNSDEILNELDLVIS